MIKYEYRSIVCPAYGVTTLQGLWADAGFELVRLTLYGAYNDRRELWFRREVK